MEREFHNYENKFFKLLLLKLSAKGVAWYGPDDCPLIAPYHFTSLDEPEHRRTQTINDEIVGDA